MALAKSYGIARGWGVGTAIVGAALSITGTPPAGVVGTPYSFTPVATGGTGTKVFALTGTLPAGLSFSTVTGAITGTPTTVETRTGIAISVTDSSGTQSLTGLSIAISAAAIPDFTFTNPGVASAWTPTQAAVLTPVNATSPVFTLPTEAAGFAILDD